MSSIVNLLVGIPLGILASLIAWWILFHLIEPKIVFDDKISKISTKDNNSGWKYKMKFYNKRSRDIIDVEIFVRLNIKGFDSQRPEVWEFLNLVSFRNRIPIMKKNGKKVIRFYPKVLNDFEFNILPKDIRNKCINDAATLEDFLNLGQEAYLKLIVYGYDGFSGTRKAFESMDYSTNNVIETSDYTG